MHIPPLPYDIKRRENEGNTELFDVIRKIYVIATPEEVVRQVFLHYLLEERGYAPGLLRVEMGFKLNGQQQRCDLVAFDNTGEPQLIVECKAPTVAINQKVFEQVSRYNLSLKAPYLVVTNGNQHYCCYIDIANKKYDFLKSVPHFTELKGLS